MPTYLSPGWLEESATLLRAVEGTGPTATVQWTVTKAPGGDATFTWVLDDGVVREVRPGPVADADVAFTALHPEHLELTKGARTASVAYMQGRLKAVGHSGTVLAVLRRMDDPAFAAALAELGARSEVAEPAS